MDIPQTAFGSAYGISTRSNLYSFQQIVSESESEQGRLVDLLADRNPIAIAEIVTKVQ